MEFTSRAWARSAGCALMRKRRYEFLLRYIIMPVGDKGCMDGAIRLFIACPLRTCVESALFIWYNIFAPILGRTSTESILNS